MNRKSILMCSLAFLLFGVFSISENTASIANSAKSFYMTSPVQAWRPTSIDASFAGRYGHTAIWTGSRMLVWGGYYAIDNFLNDGRLYDPQTNTWTPITTTNAPSGRLRHTSVWTGQSMIVWGGENAGGSQTTNTGSIYDPLTDSWTPITTTNAPSKREVHSAVWTGTEMIVWGGCTTVGCSTIFNNGGRYNPTTDTWTPITPVVGLTPRGWHQAVWTGEKMLIWGGATDNQGWSFNPTSNIWTPFTTTSAPTPTFQGASVWTGKEMLVWGGALTHQGILTNTGGRYNPLTDTWVPITTTNAPSPRSTHNAVWTGQQMIIWGGCGDSCYQSGGIYDPGSDTWIPTELTNAPIPRSNHKAVWTGSSMIVWGGCDAGYCAGSTYYNTGGLLTLRYFYYLPVIIR